jgi:hypothetical protein
MFYYIDVHLLAHYIQKMYCNLQPWEEMNLLHAVRQARTGFTNQTLLDTIGFSPYRST